ncbi:MAG: helix-turn-helix transcriptional regulator [bacterium]
MDEKLRLPERAHFVYHQSMNAALTGDTAVSRIATTIGELARTRILFCLMDGRARTATELALVAEVSPSTTTVHLKRLTTDRLVKVIASGKHRYFSLEGPHVADALESLSVLAGQRPEHFASSAPNHLQFARTCYDHLAGTVGVQLHDRLVALGWLVSEPSGSDGAYALSMKGVRTLESLGIDLEGAQRSRRRFAFACLDWSERRSHLGGALGAALLHLALEQRWVALERDSRALRVTARGRRDMQTIFGLRL